MDQCWKGGAPEANPDAKGYWDALWCPHYHQFINATGYACRLCKAKDGLVQQQNPAQPCVFRGNLPLRIQQTKCCKHEVYTCSAHGEVYANRCVACKDYKSSASKALVVILEREGHRNRQSRILTGHLERDGFEVACFMLKGNDATFGLSDWIARNRRPDAWVCWEEHANLFVNRKSLHFMAWSRKHNIATLCIDFGLLDHYRTWLLDRYDAQGQSMIAADWPNVSDAPIEWEKTDPRIQAYRRTVLGAYAAARDQKPLREPGYVAVWTQYSPRLSRLRVGPDECHWPPWCLEMKRRLEATGERVVFKSSPVEKPTEWPAELDLIPHDKQIENLNARLAVHAKYNIIVCTSLNSEWALTGIPVLTTGKSWFAGRGVYTEAQTWDDIGTLIPTVNESGRNRYLRWWIENQVYETDIAKRFRVVLTRARADLGLKTDPLPEHRPSVATITCVFAPTEGMAETVQENMRETMRWMPLAEHIVAIDAGSQRLVEALTTMGCRVILPEGGQPPRMAQLLAQAVASTKAEVICTVEQDVKLLDGSLWHEAVRLTRELPARVGGVGLECVDAEGEREYPSLQNFNVASPWDEDGGYLKTHKTVPFCCAAWRGDLLRRIDWPHVPPLAGADRKVCRMLLKDSKVLLFRPGARVFHDPHAARNVLECTAKPPTQADFTTITSVYAIDPVSASVTIACCQNLAVELPKARRVCVVDAADKGTVEAIRELGFEIVQVEDGQPPRMARLMGTALASIATPYVVFVESDVFPKAGDVVALIRHLRYLGLRAGCVEPQYVTPSGEAAGPWIASKSNGKVIGRAVCEKTFGTWSCAVYRREALESVPWNEIPQHLHSDVMAWEIMRRQGYRAFVAQDVRVLHHEKVATMASRRLRDQDRTRPLVVAYSDDQEASLRDKLAGVDVEVIRA